MKERTRNGKGLWLLVGIVLLVLTAGPSFAVEKFPTKTISIVVPWPAGGRTDIVTRMVASAIEKVIGQPVVVLNKAGASGYIGFKAVSNAKPDGYTLGMAGLGLILRQYSGEGELRWEEFKWIGQCYEAAAAVSVNFESPWKTIEEFIDYARKNPMKLKHGNTGPGGTTHLFSEGFAKEAGIKFTQIEYKGDAPVVVALASKEVDVNCSPMSAVRPLMEAGKIRVLALQSKRRSMQFPDIPTLMEKGINWEVGSLEGLIAPKDTPESIISIIESALEKAMKDPGLGESFKKLDLAVEYKNQKDFTAYIDLKDKIFRSILKEIGLLK